MVLQRSQFDGFFLHCGDSCNCVAVPYDTPHYRPVTHRTCFILSVCLTRSGSTRSDVGGLPVLIDLCRTVKYRLSRDVRGRASTRKGKAARLLRMAVPIRLNQKPVSSDRQVRLMQRLKISSARGACNPGRHCSEQHS